MVGKAYANALSLICKAQATKGHTLAVMECTRKRDGAIVNLLVIIEDYGGNSVFIRPMAEMLNSGSSSEDYLPPNPGEAPDTRPKGMEN
jgi:hypothetical protein